MKYLALTSIIIFSFACAKKSVTKTSVSSYSGSVTINDIKINSSGTTVNYNDKISTGEKSHCDLIINKKNILRIGPESTLLFRISDEDAELELQKGWLAGITRRAFSRKGRYSIKTPTVLASVRGTSYYIKVEDHRNTYFCVCNGSIELKGSAEESGDIVKSSHHTARRYSSTEDGKISIDKNPGLLYHDDSGVEELAALINEKIDWTKPDIE